MSVNGCIDIYPRGCGGWITVIWFRVLLITYYIIREILMGVVLDVYARDVRKKIIDPDIVTMYLLQKKGSWRNTYIGMHIVERMVKSISSANTVDGIVNDKSNPFRNIVMDELGMNQSYVSQCPIVDEKPNADTTKFFYFLKDCNEQLWDGYTNHGKLSVIA